MLPGNDDGWATDFPLIIAVLSSLGITLDVNAYVVC